MLACGTPADDHPNTSFDRMDIVPILEELEAEQMKLYAHIANNEQRIAALEATLTRLQTLPGYQPHFSLAENLRMVLRTLKASSVMARAVLATEPLSDAQASAACYLASLGVPSDDSSPDAADECAGNTDG
jgi:hypothetical protein